MQSTYMVNGGGSTHASQTSSPYLAEANGVNGEHVVDTQQDHSTDGSVNADAGNEAGPSTGANGKEQLEPE